MATATRLEEGDRVEVITVNIDSHEGTDTGTRGTVERVSPATVEVLFDGLDETVTVWNQLSGQGQEVKLVEDEDEAVPVDADTMLVEAVAAETSPEALAHMERRNVFQEELGRLVNVLNDLGDVTISSWELTGNKHDQFVFSMEFQTYKEAN